MSYAWRQDFPDANVFTVAWLIDAAWAHPIWSQYELRLYDLTRQAEDGTQPVLHMSGVTHEFLLHALDPDHRVRRDTPLDQAKIVRLLPANYGYQFTAASDAEAQERLQKVVDAILQGQVSPDTDFRTFWDMKLFPDAYPLVH